MVPDCIVALCSSFIGVNGPAGNVLLQDTEYSKMTVGQRCCNSLLGGRFIFFVLSITYQVSFKVKMIMM